MSNEIFTDLRNVLADLYKDEISIRRIVDESHLDASHIQFGSTTSNDWYSVLEEAKKQGQVDSLLAVVNKAYRNNKDFQVVYQKYTQTNSAELQKEVDNNSSLKLSFVNRQDDIEQITSNYAPAYHIIDAPAGFGKTYLLERLEKIFDDKKWICAHVAISDNFTISEIEQKLAEKLGIPSDRNRESPAKEVAKLGRSLGNSLIRHREDEFSQTNVKTEGLVLLIDFEGPSSSKRLLFTDLCNVFIPNVAEELNSFPFFHRTHNPFRVVIAGRFLANSSSLPWQARKLKAFGYDVVRQTVQENFRNYINAPELAAHLTHYTAGHPGCIARVLAQYKSRGGPVEEFFFNAKETIWKSIVEPEYKESLKEIPVEFTKIMTKLSVFRYLDSRILQKLLDRDFIDTEIADPHELADKLTETFLMDWQDRLLKDSITRKLLILGVHHEVSKTEFFERCQTAIQVCEEHVQDRNTNYPEKWAIEILFQFLQQHTDDIEDSQRRKEIHQTFFDKIVPNTLTLLTRKRVWQDEHRSLKQALSSDDDFTFVVNYYLRDDKYDYKPYKKLGQQVEEFFREKAKESSK